MWVAIPLHTFTLPNHPNLSLCLVPPWELEANGEEQNVLSLLSRSPSRFEIGRLRRWRVAGVQRMPGYADENVKHV